MRQDRLAYNAGNSNHTRGLLGILVGMGVALACAVAWAVLTVYTGWQIGYVAWAIGMAIGYVMCFVGRNEESFYGVIAAGISLFAILLGNVLTLPLYVVKEYDYSLMTVINELSLNDYKEYLISSFNVIDLLFYAIAVSVAYRLAFNTPEAELDDEGMDTRSV